MSIAHLPGDALGLIDNAFVFLPAIIRIALWGGLGGAVSMVLYRAVSHQGRLRELKGKIRAARADVYGYDGDFRGALPLLGRQIGLSLRLVGRNVIPVCIASLPVVFLIDWVAARFHGLGVLLPGVPVWIGGWETPFFAALFAVTLAVKILWRIH